MTAAQYKAARRARGTRKDVAPLVGMSVSGLIKRENGQSAISKQAEMLMLALPKLPKPVRDRKPGRPAASKEAKK
jgi:hypothetical protein